MSENYTCIHLEYFSRFLDFTTAGVKCRLAAVKSCPKLHFSVVIFFLSFGIIDSRTFKGWKLSTTQAGARGREGCCTFSLSHMYKLNQTVEFQCNYVVINANLRFFQIFTYISWKIILMLQGVIQFCAMFQLSAHL
jgi:hypothetical protein